MPEGWTFEESTLKDFGVIYFPNACNDKKCHIHFAFHGAGEKVNHMGKFGYNEFAAANDIIMIYPASHSWGYGHEQ